MLLSALLRIFVGLKRTIDQKLSSVLMSGPLNVAIACLMFFQFRFADTGSVLTGLPRATHPFVFLDVHRWCSRHRKCQRTLPAPLWWWAVLACCDLHS